MHWADFRGLQIMHIKWKRNTACDRQHEGWFEEEMWREGGTEEWFCLQMKLSSSVGTIAE